MSRKFVPWIAALALAVSLSGCKVEQTEPGRAPDVDVSVDPGKVPEYDVKAADVDVGTQEKQVTVPDVDVNVSTETKTITVPDVDVTPPQ